MEQTDLLRLATKKLEQLEIRYAIVDSFASGVWGESRSTQDIDIVDDIRPNQVEPLCDAFPDAEFSVSRPAAREAVERGGQFNVIHPASGNKIDFMIVGRTAWASAQLERRIRLPLFPDQPAYFAAPEDVIIGKLVYYREGGSEKHLRDITGILKTSQESVDRAYITKFARQLGVADIWGAVLDRIEQ